MFEVVIKNGYLVDGTGNPWVKADVGIARARTIADIAEEKNVDPFELTFDLTI